MEKVKAEVRVNDMWYAPIRKLTMNLYVREVIFKFITRGLKWKSSFATKRVLKRRKYPWRVKENLKIWLSTKISVGPYEIYFSKQLINVPYQFY